LKKTFLGKRYYLGGAAEGENGGVRKEKGGMRVKSRDILCREDMGNPQKKKRVDPSSKTK